MLHGGCPCCPVVYAAAYTVPGGTDDKGVPRFLRHPMFVVFTFMDVVSPASSLASVVMFLSILTSSCEIWDFRRSLPRQLMAGYALLFFSMATTMYSFTATVLINIKMDRNSWLSFLTYVAAVFPVCIFAMITPTYFRSVLEKGERTKLWIIPAITANKSTENAQG